MSKKLLNEGTIRRFMKLAALKPIGDGVISEMSLDYKRDDEEVVEEEILNPAVVSEEDELEIEDELAVDDVEEEVPVLDDAPEGDHEELLKRVVQAVAAELNVDVEIEGAAAEGEGEEELDASPPEESDALPPEEEVGADEEVLALEEEAPIQEEDNVLEAVEAMLAEAGIEVVDDKKITEDLIKKVSSRVAKRLLKEFS
jgi:hypothetical protein